MEKKALKFHQKNKEIYLFKADPNFILNMAKIQRNVTDKDYFQRPSDMEPKSARLILELFLEVRSALRQLLYRT